MPRKTQALAFIDVLTEMWRDDREAREYQRQLKLQAVVRRFVEEFRTEPVAPADRRRPGFDRLARPNGRSQPNDTVRSDPSPTLHMSGMTQ